MNDTRTVNPKHAPLRGGYRCYSGRRCTRGGGWGLVILLLFSLFTVSSFVRTAGELHMEAGAGCKGQSGASESERRAVLILWPPQINECMVRNPVVALCAWGPHCNKNNPVYFVSHCEI